ncbi:GATA transcription factor 21 isoform X1 [Vigna radiata var. radiata]|uniref:GATA transcription factor 21 isoform X1 n=2 Tax=Vigna radiata var. radiata TaxID=3916 RepID=A0A1S3UN56_VIGRR|nr:GATA transcription factor 21 isoform X1 [Vigna radiata var. radiata]
MIPAYRHSSVIPLDLNEDQNHELFIPTHHAYPSFSYLSSPYPVLFNPPDQEDGSHSWEPTKHLSGHEEAEKINPTMGSWDHSVAQSELKVTVCKQKERSEDHVAAAEDGSVKLMPSKMRMMQKMMGPDQTGAYIEDSTVHKFEDEKQPLSPLGTDNSSSNNCSNHSNNTVRVCADCHTTKTPLWRSGPRGPKSLCNACGIRQRKARRAMAAAASGNGTVILKTEKSVKGNKLQKKEKKVRTQVAPQMKKKRKHGVGAKPSQSRNKFGFEDLTLRLRKSLAMHQVFPQDEKEAAILLMALSYGLVQG